MKITVCKSCDNNMLLLALHECKNNGILIALSTNFKGNFITKKLKSKLLIKILNSL